MATNQNKGSQGGSSEQQGKAGQQSQRETGRKNSGNGDQAQQTDTGRERQSEGGRKGGQK